MKYRINLKPKAKSLKYHLIELGNTKRIKLVVSSPLSTDELTAFTHERVDKSVEKTISIKEIEYHSNPFYEAVFTKSLIGLSKYSDILDSITPIPEIILVEII